MNSAECPLSQRCSFITLDPDDFQVVTQQKRKLGRVVIRGPQVSLISPEDGMEEIANPFLAAEEEEEDDGEA